MLNINLVFSAIVVVVLMLLGMILAYGFYRSQQRTMLRRALIEKYASAQDLNEFMETPAGRRLFAEFTSGGSPLGAVLASVHRGILALLAGAGVWGIGLAVKDPAFFGAGLLLACIGLGFLISAAITYRLSKSWGLLKRD